MMKIYFYGVVLLMMCGGLVWFYKRAYDKGYEAHRAETVQAAADYIIKGQKDLITASVTVQQTQHKMEQKKTHDEICRDILNFDVRACLKP